MQKNHNLFVLSVGGSLVVPKTGIDTIFLSGFKKLVEKQVKKGKRFVIVVGGGATCRTYQQAARKVSKLDPEDLDWLGTHSTRLNGHLMRTIFRSIAHPVMFKNPTRIPKKWSEHVLIAAGWKPGWSTDYVAVCAAKQLGVKTILNLSNIDFVYTKDPRKWKTARPIEKISWKNFCAMVGKKWNPGMNVPFDPIASILAQKSGMKVIIVNGKNSKNLENFFQEKPFVGTVIE